MRKIVMLIAMVVGACDSQGSAPHDTTSTNGADTRVGTETSSGDATVATGTTSTTDAAEVSDDATVTTEAPDTASPDTHVGPPNPTGARLTFAIEPITIDKGRERQVCKSVNIPAGVAVDVVRIESRMSGKSHHFNLYKLIDGTKLQAASPGEAVVHDCAPANEQLSGDAAYIYGSATPDRVMETPRGVAYHLEGGQRLILEYHGINYTQEAVTGGVEVDLVLAAPEAVVEHHADIMWMANWGFMLPKNKETVSTRSCAVPYDVEVFSLMSHTHELGTQFTVDTIIDGDETLVYENEDWAHPIVKVFDPPLILRAGDRVQWTCTWFNWRDHTVFPAKESTDEMCMVFASAYPIGSKSAEPFQCNILF